jgi:hypothetical protein
MHKKGWTRRKAEHRKKDDVEIGRADSRTSWNKIDGVRLPS